MFLAEGSVQVSWTPSCFQIWAQNPWHLAAPIVSSAKCLVASHEEILSSCLATMHITHIQAFVISASWNSLNFIRVTGHLEWICVPWCFLHLYLSVVCGCLQYCFFLGYIFVLHRAKVIHHGRRCFRRCQEPQSLDRVPVHEGVPLLWVSPEWLFTISTS